MNCTNCNKPVRGNFCSNCGQPVKYKRIDAQYINHEIQHVLHVEKGILFTIKEMLFKPGQGIRTYISGNRNRYMKPLPFLVITSLIYTLINNYFHIESSYLNFDESVVGKSSRDTSSIPLIFNWVQSHYGYINILMSGLIALWLRMFFKRYNYNIVEIIVLLCYVAGTGMFLLAITGIIAGLIKVEALHIIMGITFLVYTIWAIGQFFDAKKALSYIKAMVAYLLGMMLFYMLLYLVGQLYDHIK